MSLFKPVIFYLVADVLVKAMQFMLMPSASYLLSVDEYGKLTLILALLTALVPLISLSSESAYSMFYNQRLGDDKNRLFINSIHVASTGFLILTTVGLLLSLIDDYLLFSILSIKYHFTKMFLTVFFEYFVILHLLSCRLSFEKSKYLLWFVAYFSVKFFAGLVSIHICEVSDAYLDSILFINIVFVALVVSRHFNFIEFLQQVLTFDKISYVRMLKYSLIIFPVSLFAVINSMVDKVYISALLPVTDLASYTSIFLIAGAIQIVVLAINKAYMPELLKLYSLHGYKALDMMVKNTRGFLFFSYFVFLSCILVLPFVFDMLFSDNIVFSFNVFVILSLSFLFNTLYILYTNVLSLAEETAKYKMFGFLLAGLVNIALGYLLTSSHGIFGSAVSTMFSCIIASMVLAVLVHRNAKKNYLLLESMMFLLCGCVTAGGAVYLNAQF